MKYLLCFIMLFAGCKVYTSAYASNINYWSFLIAQNTITIAKQGELLLNAQKEHKTDSVLFYAYSINSLVILQIQYKDSLLYYINKQP